METMNPASGSSGESMTTAAVGSNATFETTIHTELTTPTGTGVQVNTSTPSTTLDNRIPTVTITDNVTILPIEITTQPETTMTITVFNTTVEPTLPETTMATTVSSLAAETTRPLTTGFSASNQTSKVTIFSSSEATAFPTTENPSTTSNNLIGNLETWQFSVIVAAAGLVVIAIVVMVLCICRRKKKTEQKKRHELNEMWNMGTGGAEICITNMTRKDDRWKSTESVDATVTTADVIEPSTVNVFSLENDAYLSTPRKNHLSRKSTNTSLNSGRSRDSLKSTNSDASTMFRKAKMKKSLTKVEGPIVTTDKQDDGIRSVSDLDEATDDEADEKSSTASVSSDTRNTPKMATFTSNNSSPQAKSSGKSSSNSSHNNDSPSVTVDSLPSPPNVNMSEAHTNKSNPSLSNDDSVKANSFLPKSENSEEESSSDRNDLPPPPPPPVEEN